MQHSLTLDTKSCLFLEVSDREYIIDEVEDKLLTLKWEVSDDVIELDELNSEHAGQPAELTEPAAKKRKKDQCRSWLKVYFSNTVNWCIHCPHIPAKWHRNWNYTKKAPDLDSDPLAWWNTRRLLYSLMCTSGKILHFGATSVPSESLFSTLGNVVVDKHNHLTPEHADKLIFIHENV